MNTVPTHRTRFRGILAALTSALMLLTGFVAVSPAAAAPDTVAGGSMTWGMDAQYRSVFSGRGVGSPAALDSTSDLFTFPATAGSGWDADTASGSVAFQGTARVGYFAGPPMPGIADGNYFYLANPVIAISGSTGTLSGTTAGSSHKLVAELPLQPQAVRTVADLDFSGITPTVNAAGTQITWTDVPATITGEGAAVFAAYASADDSAPTVRTVGSVLDPVTITLDLLESTTVGLSAGSATATLGSSTTLTATVTPASAAGQVEFFDGGTSLGTAAVAAGIATSSFALSIGTHELTAVFSPTDTASYLASASATESVTVSVDDARVEWPFSVYSQGWQLTVTGDLQALPVPPGKTSGGFALTGGTGTIDAATGGEVLSFSGSAVYAMYPTLAADAAITLTDFVLSLDAGAASGTLTADVAVGASPASFAQDVVIARFAIPASQRVVTGDGFKAVSDAPAYLGALGTHEPYSGTYTDTWPTEFVDVVKAGAAAFGSPVNTIQSFFYRSGETAAQANKPPQPLTISYGAPIVTTPTSVTLVPGSTVVTAGHSVTFTATVSPAAAGTVEFLSGATSLGTSTVTAGAATLTLVLPEGQHLLTAEFTPGNLIAHSGSVSPVATVDMVPPTTIPTTAPPGSLLWGVKASYRDYITGNIAQGSVTVSGDATASGGRYQFPQSGASDFDTATNTGTAGYRGAVRFYGHNGQLDMTLSNPSVIVRSASTAGLQITASGLGRIEIGTINLAGASKATVGGAVIYSNAPVTLTAAGAALFQQYAAGEAMDPVTFTIGSASSQSASAQTTAAFQKNEPADTPPSTTGMMIVGDAVTGSEITAKADGFQPNEQGILVVIYSEPRLLDTIAADADGIATWTGTLPNDLVGEHTLTFQGTVDRGSVLDIEATAVVVSTFAGCTVEGASITWGFKDTFRSYISGTIAHGEWTVFDGASYETPNFGWSAGEGVYERADGTGLVTFVGGVRFTGHDGALDTSIANPQLRFDGGGQATLLFDVSGETQAGTSVDEKAVEFATIDLSSLLVSEDGTEVTITDAAVTLTNAGANAFGTYPAGESLDPISVTLALADDCAEAAPVAGEEPATPISESSDLGWLIWVGLAALLLAILVTVIVVLRRRSA